MGRLQPRAAADDSEHTITTATFLV